MSGEAFYFTKDPYHDYTSHPGGQYHDSRYMEAMIRLDKNVQRQNPHVPRRTNKILTDLLRAGLYVAFAIGGMSLLSRSVR